MVARAAPCPPPRAHGGSPGGEEAAPGQPFQPPPRKGLVTHQDRSILGPLGPGAPTSSRRERNLVRFCFAPGPCPPPPPSTRRASHGCTSTATRVWSDHWIISKSSPAPRIPPPDREQAPWRACLEMPSSGHSRGFNPHQLSSGRPGRGGGSGTTENTASRAFSCCASTCLQRALPAAAPRYRGQAMARRCCFGGTLADV